MIDTTLKWKLRGNYWCQAFHFGEITMILHPVKMFEIKNKSLFRVSDSSRLIEPKTAFSFTFEGDLLASCSGLDIGAQGSFV